MLKRILPFTLDSPFKSYNNSAAVGGVLFTEEYKDRYTPYYYSNNILLVSNEHQDLGLADDIWYKNECMDFHYYATDMVDSDEIKNLICRMIEKGFYVSGELDEIDIPYSRAYHKNHFFHDIFIYGYDLEKGLFYTGGFDTTLSFSLHEMDIKLLTVSLWKPLNSFFKGSRLLFFKPKSHPPINQINIKLVLQRLQEMLMSTFEYADDFPTWTYGLSVYTHVCSRLMGKINMKREVNGSTFFALYEHKKMMCKRIHLLEQTGIKIPIEVKNTSTELLKKAEQLKNQFAKYRIAPSTEVRDKLISGLRYMEEIEKTELAILISCITLTLKGKKNYML